MQEIALIYVTFPDEKSARFIGETLLKLKLIACFNYFKIKSMYRWDGEIKREDEITAIIKTQTSLATVVKEKISTLHPYEVPCILISNWEVNDPYFHWVVQVSDHPS